MRRRHQLSPTTDPREDITQKGAVKRSLDKGFPGGSDSKESACNAGDLGLIPKLGRCPEEGNGNPLQYSCPENSMDRGAWQATVYGVPNS